MAQRTARSEHGELDERQRELLEAALSVFMRFGFRKTSMDEVARAAHISRQGLYLRFSTKEELFKATVQHFLEVSSQCAREHLGNAARTLEERLVAAFDEVVGRFAGALGSDAADLGDMGKALVGDMLGAHEAEFVQAVARTLRAAGLPASYRAAGLNAHKLAETLHACARGLKYSAGTREAFHAGMVTAVRAVCFPLLRAG